MVEIAKFFVMKYPLPEEVTMPTYGYGLLIQERTVSCTVRGNILSGLAGFVPKGRANKSLLLCSTRHVTILILDQTEGNILQENLVSSSRTGLKERRETINSCKKIKIEDTS